jgi:hypothetical protein
MRIACEELTIGRTAHRRCDVPTSITMRKDLA